MTSTNKQPARWKVGVCLDGGYMHVLCDHFVSACSPFVYSVPPSGWALTHTAPDPVQSVSRNGGGIPHEISNIHKAFSWREKGVGATRYVCFVPRRWDGSTGTCTMSQNMTIVFAQKETLVKLLIWWCRANCELLGLDPSLPTSRTRYESKSFVTASDGLFSSLTKQTTIEKEILSWTDVGVGETRSRARGWLFGI